MFSWICRMNIHMAFAAILSIISNDILVYGSQLTTQGCGSSVNCFYGTSCTSNVDCDYLIKFKYDAASKSVYFEIGGKHDWVAFGLRDMPALLMDGNIGEACAKVGSTARILSFATRRFAPNFRSEVGLFNVTTSVVNGNAVCRYSRFVSTPNGTSLRDLAVKWYLTSAYGSMTGNQPEKHPRGYYATSSEKVEFTNINRISSAKAEWDTLLLVHSITGTLAWLVFSFVGIFIARYMRDAFWGKKLGGKDLWFQLHRIFMVLTMLTSIVCIATIMAKLKGWNADFAGVHAYTGIVAQVIGATQVIGGNLRPSPSSSRRGLFNIIHRTFGVLALLLAGLTVLLGLKLVDISMAPVIVWFVFGFLVVLGLEIYLRFAAQGQPNSEDVDMGGNGRSQESNAEVSSKTWTTMRICFVFVVIGVMSISISIFSLFGTNNHDHSH